MKKNILITGSTDGVGKLTAADLARQGHTVYLHGRNKAKLEGVISELKSVTKNENIFGFVADLSELENIQPLIEEVLEKVSYLDVLINNAGVFKSKNLKNSKGLDLRFVVNYLAPYTLTQGLVPLLEKSENSRVINLSSAAQAPVTFPALSGQADLVDQSSYAQSKLALTMWSFRLAKKLDKSVVIAVNPGSLLNTNMVKEAFGHHWAPADKGSQILMSLATSDEHLRHSGDYYDNDRGGYGDAHPNAYDPEMIDELIKWTQEILSH